MKLAEVARSIVELGMAAFVLAAGLAAGFAILELIKSAVSPRRVKN